MAAYKTPTLNYTARNLNPLPNNDDIQTHGCTVGLVLLLWQNVIKMCCCVSFQTITHQCTNIPSSLRMTSV